METNQHEWVQTHEENLARSVEKASAGYVVQEPPRLVLDGPPTHPA